jgi:hypothetical protein
VRYPKVFEEAEGTALDESGRTDCPVTVTVGEDRDGNAAVKLSVEDDDHKHSVEARLDASQVEDLRDGLTRLLED